MEDGEVNLVYGKEHGPRSGDVIIFLDVGKGRRIVRLFKVMENYDMSEFMT